MQYLVKTKDGFKTAEGESSKAVRDYFLELGIVTSVVIPWPFDLSKYRANAGLKNKECKDLFFQLANLMRSTGSIGTSVNLLEGRFNMTQGVGFTSSKIKTAVRNLAAWYYRDKFKKYILFLKDFKERISAGTELPEIFSSHRFNDVVLTLLKASAEKTGDYVAGFEKCAEFFEAKEKYKKGLIDALAYPAMLFFMLYVSFFVFTFYVVPAFAAFFSHFRGISGSTLFVIDMFAFLKAYYFYYTGALVLLAGVFYYFFILDKWQIKTKFFNALAQIPVVGSLFQFEFLRYFAYEFGVLISAGETPATIMKFLKDGTSNDFYRQKIGLAYAHVAYGYSLWESFQAAGFLRPQDIYFISSAEHSGSLDSAFMELSKTYESLFELEVKIFRKILTGLSFAVIILFIFFIFGGIYLPMIKGMLSMRG